MNTLDLNACGVSEMNKQEMVNIDGGYAPRDSSQLPILIDTRTPREQLEDIIKQW